MTTTSPNKPTFADIPLRDISVSSTNPRKQFKPDALEDLAASIRKHGILQPILIRPIAKGFEIVAGERRYRASKLAGIDKVPCRIKDMSDSEALEVQVIENLQREDVHPLEEAQGYAELLKLPGYDVTAIADKIGRSLTYVRGRLSMLDGIPEVRAAFAAESITASHMRIICRLHPEKQAEALENCFEGYGDKRLLPVADLREWIASEMGVELSGSPFSLLDADLVGSAGACIVCPKSSCSDGKLFGDHSGEDLCYDKVCYAGKVAATIARHVADGMVRISRAWGREDLPEGTLRRGDYTEIEADDIDDQCAHAEAAVVVSEHGAGTVIQICRHGRCSVHGDPLQEAKERTERIAASSNDWQAQHKEAEAKKKAELEGRARAAAVILAKVDEIGTSATCLILINELLANARIETLLPLLKAREIEPRKTVNSWEASAGAKIQLMLWAREYASCFELDRLVTEIVVAKSIDPPASRRIQFADEVPEVDPNEDVDEDDKDEEAGDSNAFDPLKVAAESIGLEWAKITAPPAGPKKAKPAPKKKAK